LHQQLAALAAAPHSQHQLAWRARENAIIAVNGGFFDENGASEGLRISDGTLPKAMETILGELEPEASYFFTNNGERCMFIVFDMEDPSEIPSVAEPFFMAFNARVEFQPVMNLQDLQKALSGIDTTVKKYHSMPKPRAA